MRFESVSKMGSCERRFWGKTRFFLALGVCAFVLGFSVTTPAEDQKPEVEIALASRKVQDGHLAHLRLSGPGVLAPDLKAHGRLGETRFEFFGVDGVFAVPFNTPPGAQTVEVTLESAAGTRKVEIQFEVISGNYKEEALPVDPKFVKLSEESLARISEESRDIAQVYGNSSPERLWVGRFRLPIKSRLTSRFGNKRMFNGALQSFHTGADLKAHKGRSVRAAGDGIVVMTRDLFFTGNTVIIDHGLGFLTVYAHLSHFKAKQGDRVKAGQIVAFSGNTGRSSGPHLHWGAVAHRVKFDPLDLLKVLP